MAKNKDEKKTDTIIGKEKSKEEGIYVTPANINVQEQIWRLTFAMLDREEEISVIVQKVDELEKRAIRMEGIISQLCNIQLIHRPWYIRLIDALRQKKT